MKVKVCHISTVHTRKDIRIFVKEASSLAKSNLYDVSYIVADGLQDEIAEGVYIQSIPKFKRRLVRMLKGSLKILLKAKSLKANIYHIHDPELFWLVGLLKSSNTKVILDLHEDLPMQILSKPYLGKNTQRILSTLAEYYERIFLPKASAIVTATPFIEEKIIQSKLNKLVVCLSNFPLKNEFITKPAERAVEELNAFCYTGGITSIRGIGELLECVLNTKDADWVLHLAGPIGDNNIKMKLEDAMTKTNRIKYWGNVDRRTLSEIFNQSLAGFVTFLPVPNHLNAVPNKLFEYMSAGLPVICSNFPSWDHLINGSTGLTVDPKDSTAIIERINFLLENREVAKKFGENGIKAIDTQYNWEMESEKLLNLYKKV